MIRQDKVGVVVMVLITVLAAPFILYVPGWLLMRAVNGAGWQQDLLETHYERVAISALLSGWLALLLAELGVFSLWLQLALLVLLSGGLWVWGRRHRSDLYSPESQHWQLRHRRELFAVLAFVFAGLSALLLVVRPFETVLGARDAGVYANTGFAIARTGSLVQHDALLAGIGQATESRDTAVAEPAKQAMSNFLGVQNPNRYIATRMRATGFFINDGEAAAGRVVPQFLHLFPSWIALLTSVAGVYGGLFAPGLMAVLGAWSVGMLGRRLAGSAVGVLAFVLLALNSVQVWFGRYSTSETTAQFLTFAGLYFFAKYQHIGQWNADERKSVVGKRSAILYAAVAGIAFGQLALTRVDFFLVVAPVLLFLLYCGISRRWQAPHTALVVALGAMLLHAGLHVVFIARAYFFDTGFERIQDYALTAYLALPFVTPTLREVYGASDVFTEPVRLWQELAMLLTAIVALVVLWCWQQPVRWVEAMMVRSRRLLLAGTALGIIALAGYAYLIRPQIIDMDILFNARQGWNDPLERDPRFVQADVNEWRMTLDVARSEAGVVLVGDPEYAATAIDEAATAELRAQLRAARGPWQGPFSNQTFNWMRLQGYVGAPIALPRTFYDDGEEWWREYAENVPPGVQPPTGLPVQAKDIIPLANFVRVGWYLSPLGVGLGVVGFALWWWRGMSRAAWLFFVIALLGTFFFVRQTYGTSDQTYIYILRRFVPTTYPAFSLGMAYAIVALVRWSGIKWPPSQRGWSMVWRGGATIAAGGLALAMMAFFIWTGKTIYRHVEYDGAVAQIAALAEEFDSNDVLLLRGGGPTYHIARDIPDIVATPLRFTFGVDALTVKSNQPGAYADSLAAQVRSWRSQDRDIYLVLSANGGDFVLPGFSIEPVDTFTLHVPEFEQLTGQKPHNTAMLKLPFAIYRLSEAAPDELTALAAPLDATDFAAQVQGFYLPETEQARMEAASSFAENAYAWTNGDAVVRLTVTDEDPPRVLAFQVAGGERPPHLGATQVCVSFQPEATPWPTPPAPSVDLGCRELRAEMATYHIALDQQQVELWTTSSVLLHLESNTWVPADEDPRLHDRRAVGVRFGGVTVGDAAALQR